MTYCLDTFPGAAASTAMVRVDGGLALRSIGRRDRLAAAVLSGSLDAQLARGEAPEERWLRAVRASRLTAPDFCADLADAWGRVLARAQGRAHRPRNTVSPAGAYTRDAQQLIAALIDALQQPGPARVRGVAMATVLLTDGTGPLYRPRSAEHLAAAIGAAHRHLQAVHP